MRRELRRRFRFLLSGSPSGVPAWTPLVAVGEDAGLFAPDDEPWVVHADLATMIGGIRALLMQALHPGALAGVAQHSRYEEAVLDRLSGTIRWLTISTFGARAAVEQEAQRVRAMHERVRGSYQSRDGAERNYSAADQDLLLWVHIAFTDSFLAAHQVYGSLPVNADAYVAKWGDAVQVLGLQSPPRSVQELEATLEAMRPALEVQSRTRSVVHFIRRAPLPVAARPAYRMLFLAAVDLLPPDRREILGLSAPPRWLVRPLTHVLLRVLRWIIGNESPLERAALDRRRRVNP